MRMFVRLSVLASLAVFGLPGVAASPALVANATSPGAWRGPTFTVTPASVTGPIPSTSTDYPFIADGFGPEPAVPAGYEESEYFTSGTGNLYEYTPTGIRVVTPCPASTEPFVQWHGGDRAAQSVGRVRYRCRMGPLVAVLRAQW